MRGRLLQEMGIERNWNASRRRRLLVQVRDIERPGRPYLRWLFQVRSFVSGTWKFKQAQASNIRDDIPSEMGYRPERRNSIALVERGIGRYFLRLWSGWKGDRERK